LIALIWAQARDANGRAVIGAQGEIPWHLPEDFQHFKSLTSGHPVIMGERTWVSLPKKPLPNRTNIVLTENALIESGALAATSLDQAVTLAKQAPGGELAWVIGGESVYQQTLPIADRLEVTEIDLVVSGDTYAPEISPALFQPELNGQPWQLAKNGLRYRFTSYNRTSKLAQSDALTT